LFSAAAKTLLSSLLRADAVAVVDVRSAGPGPYVALPQVFSGRVLRHEHVGLQLPVSLAVPTSSAALSAIEEVDEEEEEEVEALPPPPPPDYALVEEAARELGFGIGFEQGHLAGLAAAEQSMADSVQRMISLANHVRENHALFFRAAEREVVDLALQIAQKVVEREIENMPDLALSVIRAALEEMDARTAVRVRVSPDDEELLRRRWSQVVPPGIGAERIELQKDERVKSGGAVIETTHGEVDAQLESKLAQLGNALWTFVMNVDNAAQTTAGSADA
jgi:flagellar biosynthesis/type III secretory pathway protein FliH